MSIYLGTNTIALGGMSKVMLGTNQIWVEEAAAPSYILDAASSAVTAYSLRKLKTGATKAIRVRRSSDNAEQDIGFDANGDLDESALTTFCSTGNGFVSVLYNQITNGASDNYAQATAGTQPRIVASGVVEKLNNKPTLNCKPDATARIMTITKSYSQPHAVSMVLYQNDTYKQFVRNAGDYDWRIGMTEVNHYYIYAGTELDNSSSMPTTVVVQGYFNGANSYINVNETHVTGNAGTNSAVNPTLNTNPTSSANCKFSELIFFNSDSDLASIKASQGTYYGITVS